MFPFSIINKAVGAFFLHADAAKPWQLGFQSPATPTMEGIIRFHHDLMFLVVVVVVFVGYMMFRCLQHFNEEKHPVAVQVVHGSVIEVVWTIIPALILMVVAVPSFALLYSADELIEPALTLKVVGHQW
jgi:heme/copper-type cytochrome/quinol oxidase subunit 2